MRMRTRERGVAIVTALLLTTLAVTIVASLFWQQQVQVRSMENQRLHLQTRWIVRGALDWARLILLQDGLDSPKRTTLEAVWATPLAETRLDQYIERERVQGETFDATLSGYIQDAQSRYNLANLAQRRVINDAQVTAFGRLLENLRLNRSLARRVAETLAMSQRAAPAPKTDSPPPQAPVGAGGNDPMGLTQLDDLLAVPGFTPETVAALREFVIVLPEPTKVNVNTASAEVLSAVTELSVSEAQSLVFSRKNAYFNDMVGFVGRLNGKKVIEGVGMDVKTGYFLVISRVRLDRAELSAQALIKRPTEPSAGASLVWIREN